MRFEAFDRMALALPGAVMDVKWAVDRCYCVGGKMFAFAGQLGNDEPRYVFKCSDLSFEMLVESGAAVLAPYLARAKWVQLIAHDALPDETLGSYVAQAHGIIAAKLTKKARAEIGL